MQAHDAIAVGFRRSIQFSGRASRREYWTVSAVSASCILLAAAFDRAAGLRLPASWGGGAKLLAPESGGIGQPSARFGIRVVPNTWLWLSALLPPVRGPLSLAAFGLCVLSGLATIWATIWRRTVDAGRSAPLPLLAFVAPGALLFAGPALLPPLVAFLGEMAETFGVLVGVMVMVLAPVVKLLALCAILPGAYILFAHPSALPDGHSPSEVRT